MKSFAQPGDTLTLPAPSAVPSGGGAKIGGIFGLAARSAGNGAPVDLVTTGVFDLAKVGTDVFTLGAAVYWNDSAKLAAADADTGGEEPTAHQKIGAAVAAAANPSATVRVRLSGA